MKYLLLFFLIFSSCNFIQTKEEETYIDSTIIFLDTISSEPTTNLDSLNKILDSIESRIPKIKEKNVLYVQTTDSLKKVNIEMKIKEKKLKEKEIECLIYLSREHYNSTKSFDTLRIDTNRLNEFIQRRSVN